MNDTRRTARQRCFGPDVDAEETLRQYGHLPEEAPKRGRLVHRCPTCGRVRSIMRINYRPGMRCWACSRANALDYRKRQLSRRPSELLAPCGCVIVDSSAPPWSEARCSRYLSCPLYEDCLEMVCERDPFGSWRGWRFKDEEAAE